jgi:hypothetical protein
MTFEELMRTPQQLLLKAISGSRSQLLHSPTSDTDLRGIFVLPLKELYGFNYTPQVANATNDEVYFEIGRFLELLQKNNPSILELLDTPESCVLFRHQLMSMIRPSDFLSKLCKDTFAGYAASQIKKAKGLNKMINRPLERERKGVMDFCYVIEGNGSINLATWLERHGYKQEDCGLTNVPHFRDVYLVYHHPGLKGIVSGADANDVRLSSIPAGLSPVGTMQFNKDGYSVYCREYREYEEWIEKRNDARFQNTMSTGKSYDAKNMMHTFRLLNMAEEIALHHKVIIERPDREFLLKIKAGAFEYDELLAMVDEKLDRINELFQQSDLPEAPDEQKTNELLVTIREHFYQ